MQRQADAERVCGALARVVVRGRADAAEAEDDVRTGERTPQSRRDALGLVAQVLAPGKPEPTLRQCLDEEGKVLVLALADEDFVANDEGAESGYQYPRPQ